MEGLLPKESASTKPPQILDVRQLIEDYAWRLFDQLRRLSKNRSEFRSVDRNDVIFEVNSKRLMIEHLEPQFTPWSDITQKPCTLFKATFRNDTDREQAYSFKTERSTESVCMVFLEKGFETGVEAELTLTTPCEILEFQCGFKHQIHVNKGNEQAQCESLSWGVDTCISVPPKYETIAELKIDERNYKGSFTVTSRLSGAVTVVLRHYKTNEIIMPCTANIVEVFTEATRPNMYPAELMKVVHVEKSWVTIQSAGRCSFQFACNQQVSLNEKPMGPNVQYLNSR